MKPQSAPGGSPNLVNQPLFVYGTLRSGERSHGLIEKDVVRIARAVAFGRRVDTHAPYPGVCFDGSERIDGELIWFEPSSYLDVIARLDRYEGVPRLFDRVEIEVSADDGNIVNAVAYEWRGSS